MSKVELFRAFNLQVIVVNEGRHEDKAAELLAGAKVMMNRLSLYPACQILNGVAETAIADYVKHTKVDLLVAGAYVHTRIRELLIGSTTTALLRNCHVPVLCFR
jgi:nucleotide-binding universal stress UspA family protein